MHNAIKAAVTSGALFVSVIAQAGGAMAAEQGYVVVNKNDEVAIQQVYVANAGESDAWRPANMDHAIAPRTESTFTIGGSNCLYDVKVRFSDGDEQTFDNVNVCRRDRVIAD